MTDETGSPAGTARRAGIADVAASAGVSMGTASKALNGRGQLRDETRARVQAAAEELGFIPERRANLLTGRTFTVGLIMTDNHGRFGMPMMRGAEDALRPARSWRSSATAGTIRCASSTTWAGCSDAGSTGDRGGSPCRGPPANLKRGSAGAGRLCLRAEPRPRGLRCRQRRTGGAKIAVEHLVRTGRRRIAHVPGPVARLGERAGRRRAPRRWPRRACTWSANRGSAAGPRVGTVRRGAL